MNGFRYLALALAALGAACASGRATLDPPYTLRDAEGRPVAEKKPPAKVVDRYILLPSESASTGGSASTAVIPAPAPLDSEEE